MTTAEYNAYLARRGKPGAAVKRPARRPKGAVTYGKEFFALWTRLGGVPLVAEHHFHPSRKWRLDYAVPDAKVGIEIHGAVWRQGRHTRGKGFIGDRRKMNAATAMGWRVWELSPEMIREDDVRPIVEAANQKAAEPEDKP